MSLKTRRTALVAGVSAFALVLTACGSSSSGSSTSTAADTGGGGARTPSLRRPELGATSSRQKYGDLTGKTVSVYTTISGTEADRVQERLQAVHRLHRRHGVSTRSPSSFEADITSRIDAGNPPDVAIFPQPGLISQIVNEKGAIKPLDPEIEAFAKQYFPDDWMNYGVVNDISFGLPNNADFKSLVWYNPKIWAEKGWKIPTTWDELQTLQTTIAGTGTKPWCMGIGSGAATGWYLTDWLEEYVLRQAGPDVYDQWVTHEVKFSDKPIADALAEVGKIAKNPEMVNAGFGDVQSHRLHRVLRSGGQGALRRLPDVAVRGERRRVLPGRHQVRSGRRRRRVLPPADDRPVRPDRARWRHLLRRLPGPSRGAGVPVLRRQPGVRQRAGQAGQLHLREQGPGPGQRVDPDPRAGLEEAASTTRPCSVSTPPT